MSRELLQQALKAIVASHEYTVFDVDFPKEFKPIVEAIEAALAQPEQEEPLPLVDIGVDVTPEGTHVVACYNRPDAVQEMFYSQFHPLAKPEQEPVCDKDPFYCWSIRCQVGKVCKHAAPPSVDRAVNAMGKKWYGLSDKDCDKAWEHAQKSSPYGVTRIEVFAKDIERRLKERNNAV